MFDTTQSKRLHSFFVVSFATFCVADEIVSGRYLEVVHDTGTKAGRLIEDTYDWYALASRRRWGASKHSDAGVAFGAEALSRGIPCQ